MTYPNIEDFDALLDDTCADVVGDTISYKAAGAGGYSAIKADVDYRDGEVVIGHTEAISQDITVAVMKTRVPAKPAGAVRIKLPKIPGKVYRPIRVRNDRSGTHWEFDLSEVAS